jgi:hypothetical protein
MVRSDRAMLLDSDALCVEKLSWFWRRLLSGLDSRELLSKSQAVAARWRFSGCADTAATGFEGPGGRGGNRASRDSRSQRSIWSGEEGIEVGAMTRIGETPCC